MDTENENVLEHKQSKPKRGILGRSGTLKRIGQTFKLFNLRTGKMENSAVSPFLRESGAGRTIATTSEEELVKRNRKKR